MSDRRRSDEYRSLTVYLPNQLVDRVKDHAKKSVISQNEIVEQALYFYYEDLAHRKPETIHQLVAFNLEKLKEAGFKAANLLAIARGELLPTRVDFCEILTRLEVPKEERKRLWSKAYGNDNKDCTEDEKQRFESH